MIARLTSHDWKTVTKVIKEVVVGRKHPVKKPHPQVLDPYQEQIIEWIEEGLIVVSIFEELQKQNGYNGFNIYMGHNYLLSCFFQLYIKKYKYN